MFRAIDASCRKQGYKPKSHHAEFDGFDGNNDHPQYGFAHFVPPTFGSMGRTEGSTRQLPQQRISPPISEHAADFVPYWTRFDLTPEQIEMVADAK